MLINYCNTTLSPAGAYKAVIVKFSLPPGCYATMALRELLKKDTSWIAQQAYVQELGIPELPTSPKRGRPPSSPKQVTQQTLPEQETLPASPKQTNT